MGPIEVRENSPEKVCTEGDGQDLDLAVREKKDRHFLVGRKVIAGA